MNKEIEELLKGMRDVSNTEGCSMNLDRYLVKLLLSHIEKLNLENKFAKEYEKNYRETLKKNKQLENNRDKAIEILNKWEKENINPVFRKGLLKILKGDSE